MRVLAYRDSEEVGLVESCVQEGLAAAAKVSCVVTTASVGDDGVDGKRDRPDGVVRVAVKFTVRPVGSALLVPSPILSRSLSTYRPCIHICTRPTTHLV